MNSSDSTVGCLEDLFNLSAWPAINTFNAGIPEGLLDLDVWPPIALRSLIGCDDDFGWDARTKSFLTFDFRKQYPHSVLVHTGRGGGFGFDLLRRLRLVDSVRAKVSGRLSSLPNRFDAIQVRNTDIKSNVESLLRKADLSSSKYPLLICSDDEELISFIQNALSGVRQVFVLRKMRVGIQNTPLHYDSSIPVNERNIDLISDLIAMAMASRLFVAAPRTGAISGFPRLVKALHSHPEVALRLMH